MACPYSNAMTGKDTKTRFVSNNAAICCIIYLCLNFEVGDQQVAVQITQILIEIVFTVNFKNPCRWGSGHQAPVVVPRYRTEYRTKPGLEEKVSNRGATRFKNKPSVEDFTRLK